MSDDVLLKYWKLDELDISKIWFPFKLDSRKSYELNPNYVHYQEWGWWKSEKGLCDVAESQIKYSLICNESCMRVRNA